MRISVRTLTQVTAAEHPDSSAAVAAARRPAQKPSMPAVDLRLRLATSTALRRPLPTGALVGMATAKGRQRWQDREEREHALQTMSAIVSGTNRASEVEQLARRRLVEETVKEALFWQPWRTVSVDEASREHMRVALSSKRRLILSACHLGPYFLNMSAFSAVGCSPIVISAPWFFAEPSPDYWGRRLARWRRGVAEREERLACSSGGFTLARALLEQDEVLLNYFDMPGSRSTMFLGKPVMLTRGSAELSFQTEALVLPLRARRQGSRVWTDVLAPLDPRDFTTAQELHLALADVHERAILELAETLEDPNRPGAWEHGATEREWARPIPRPVATSESGGQPLTHGAR
jgi:lauroyl/myristoyl acyltransferase